MVRLKSEVEPGIFNDMSPPELKGKLRGLGKIPWKLWLPEAEKPGPATVKGAVRSWYPRTKEPLVALNVS